MSLFGAACEPTGTRVGAALTQVSRAQTSCVLIRYCGFPGVIFSLAPLLIKRCTHRCLWFSVEASGHCWPMMYTQEAPSGPQPLTSIGGEENFSCFLFV